MDVDMEVDGTPTPKSRGQPKRKRQGSTPPPVETATPIPTVSPKLSVTPLAPPPPPLVQQKSDATSSSSSSSSSLSQIIAPSPSPVSFLPPRPVSTVGQQVQVIATKKFQQLSSPLLHNISAHRFANLFMAPVGERVAPGYSRLVYRPMDLKTIKAAIKNGAAAVNQLTAANASTAPIDPPTTPSTPSSTTFAQTGQGYSLHPATTAIVPPKGIVNSAQLEKELFRMFANAVMYNKSNTEIVKETVEMGKEVERWVGEFRSAERVGGERARAGGSVAASSAAGWRGAARQSIGGAAKAESVTSGRGGPRKGKEVKETKEAKEKDTKRRQSVRQKKGEEEEEEQEQKQKQEQEQVSGDEKMEDGDEDEEAEENGDEEEEGEDGDEAEEEGDGESAAESNEAEEGDEDEDGDGKSMAGSVAESTAKGGVAKRGGRGTRRGVKRGKRRR
ncbi:Bromodomain-containing protein [Tirmania nivea]|nr:Bromodomain-containing protein [Tirmania nivea]